ncbi:thiopeptide maturation pyridine synthase [Streptomyces sp. NPDC045714]|uniref:thiopeptide maturation pyridine synthase n=1 Tax=Streptomyces sp. NPDC045714 TaxID=3154913 RepID=UPI0033C34459
MMWRTYRVTYYDEDRDGLLLEAVKPLVERIAPHVSSVHYLPHWLHGPHVRINVDARPQVFEDIVRPAVDEVIGAYLATHPSTAVLDAERTTRRHERLAELEHEPGPLTPLLPDNSVREIPYDRRLHVLGSQRAADLLADFYTATTPLAFATVAHLRTGGRLTGLAFDTMIASAHGLSGTGLRQGFVSFRSHAEAFLSWWPEAVGLREAWDRHYAAHRGHLLRRLEVLLAAIESEAARPPFVRGWLDAAGDVVRHGADLIAAGDMSMDPPWAHRSAENDELAGAMLRKSPFHNRRRPPGVEVDTIWFDGYRLTLNYTYLHLTRLGLTPVERFLLCHLAANAAEDLYQVSATDVTLPAPGQLRPADAARVREPS